MVHLGFEIQKSLLCSLHRVGRTFIKFYDPVDRLNETPEYSRNINFPTPEGRHRLAVDGRSVLQVE